MSAPVLWLGGWASHLACWRAELESLYPRREHLFLDAHAVLAEPESLDRAAAGLPPEATLVAWSLGSLLLHRALAQGSCRPACHLLSACPIFRFQDNQAVRRPGLLDRMIRKLSLDREAVLRDFWTVLQGETRLSPSAAAAWMDQALRISPESLLAGLEALRDIHVEAGLPAFADGHIDFLASGRDPLAPPAAGMPAWREFPRGHLPFLEYPRVLAGMLTERERSP